ncbi:hypothetical protein [Mucilaginibacter sp. HD30]
MNVDNIKEIQIDDLGRLRIYPEREVFTLIWRSATEVHWDEKNSFLYSPKPREWSYLNWYQHIIGVIETEYHCKLLLTPDTKWVSISQTCKDQMLLQ